MTDLWTNALQKSQCEEEKFVLYKLLIKLYEERGHFRKMAGFAAKQFDMVRNSVQKDHVLTASLNLARAKLFLGEHQEAAKMANYVRISKVPNNCHLKLYEKNKMFFFVKIFKSFFFQNINTFIISDSCLNVTTLPYRDDFALTLRLCLNITILL